jgi:polyhydroxyalkanoate synthase
MLTPKDVVHREGTAQLYRFRRPNNRPAVSDTPLLLVPSLINRWYILDLREGASVAAALAEHLDVWLLDWGVPNDEDRYLSWDSLLKKLGRAVRVIQRTTGSGAPATSPKVSMLGYCMGATLAGIWTALHPKDVASFVNLAGPFDFSKAGTLATMVDRSWFDVAAIASAGNITPPMMQAGFWAFQPTQQLAKMMFLPETLADPVAREAFFALEAWANDNVPFPAAAYETYIRELYQENKLIRGEHWALGRRVDLKAIDCPVMTIVASRDAICPPSAATALNDAVSSIDKRVFSVKGGHVGAVVGKNTSRDLYPALTAWFTDYHRGNPLAAPANFGPAVASKS